MMFNTNYNNSCSQAATSSCRRLVVVIVLVCLTTFSSGEAADRSNRFNNTNDISNTNSNNNESYKVEQATEKSSTFLSSLPSASRETATASLSSTSENDMADENVLDPGES
jgi:hypothetical protein